jgi:hypothetical protein
MVPLFFLSGCLCQKATRGKELRMRIRFLPRRRFIDAEADKGEIVA